MQAHRVAAALSALALACGGAQVGGSSGHGAITGTTKTYKPLAIKDDSKQPNQAVILGTDAKDGSTVLTLPAAASKALVDALWFQGGNPPSGGFSPVKLATAPNSDGTVQVGIMEEFSGGTGPQWRAGVWVSAFVAASTLGKDLTDYTFSASSGGYIDGASASGLMAGGFLAAMTGRAVDPSTTMTGIINPDGTIGPVAGIPEKFLGAIAKGKKRLGYPIGMRFAKSEASGEMVDLVQLATDHGAQAFEISNVREAYRLLTGLSLPEVVPVDEADMKIDEATNRALDAKTLARQREMAPLWTTVVQLQSAGRLPPTLAQMAELAHKNATESEKLREEGFSAAAYADMMVAWGYALATATTAEVLTKAQGGNAAGALGALDALAQQGGTDSELFKKVGAFRPATLGGHLRMLAAYQAALRAWGAGVYGESAVAKAKAYVDGLGEVDAAQLATPEAADRIVDAVATPALLLSQRVAQGALATDWLELAEEHKLTYLCSIPNVVRLSTSFQSASAAAITYFDNLLVSQLATQMKISQDEARDHVAMAEPDYMVALITSRLRDERGLPAELKTLWGERSLPWGLMSLAGNELAYYDSAQLIAKYYSLEVSGEHVEHEKAFINMLTNAERTARESARAARIATGAIPMEAKLSYQLATIEREGNLSDKLAALGAYWQASAYSQTAVMLARN